MTFHVGQKLVCVRYPANGGYGDEVKPQIGRIYTIREIDFAQDGEIGFYLHEIKNPPRSYLRGVHEIYFRQRNFRPVIERKTDISIFTRMLLPKELTAPVPAKRSTVPQPS